MQTEACRLGLPNGLWKRLPTSRRSAVEGHARSDRCASPGAAPSGMTQAFVKLKLPRLGATAQAERHARLPAEPSDLPPCSAGVYALPCLLLLSPPQRTFG